MIPRSPYIAAASLALAGALHAAFAVLPTGAPEQIVVQGGGGEASISTLGDSFADMAEGAPVPEPEAATMAEPSKTPAPRPEANRAETPTSALTPNPAASPTALAPLQESVAPAPGSTPPVEQARSPSPDPLDRLVAEAGTSAPESSIRPQARPDRPEPKRRTTPTPKQSGNANRSARAGDASGRENAQQQQAGSSQNARTRAGNAAVANYPGEVMRHIQRTRRERVNVRGSAQVSFTIAANGALAAVSIARSSGSARLDQVALQQIHRAAPFPPPPAGARRNFTLRIDGT